MTIKQFFHVDCFVGRHAVHAVDCRDDITGLTVLKNQFDAVCGIIRIARDIGSSSLQYTEERENQSAGTRQQQGHTIALLHALLTQGSSNRIRGFIHLLVGVLRIDGHQSLMVGLGLCEMTDTLVEELEGRIACCGLTQV